MKKNLVYYLFCIALLLASPIFSMKKLYDESKNDLYSKKYEENYKSVKDLNVKTIETNKETYNTIKIVHDLSDVLKDDGELITYVGIGTYSSYEHTFGYLQSLPSFLENFIKDKKLKNKVKIILIDEAWNENCSNTGGGDFKAIGYDSSSLKKYIDGIEDKELRGLIKESIYIMDKNVELSIVDAAPFIRYAKKLLNNNGAFFLGEGVRDIHNFMCVMSKFTDKKDEFYKSRLQLISVYTMQSTLIKRKMNGQIIDVYSVELGNPIWWGNAYNEDDYESMLNRNGKENITIESEKHSGKFVALGKDTSFEKLPELKFSIQWTKDRKGIEKIVPKLKKL